MGTLPWYFWLVALFRMLPLTDTGNARLYWLSFLGDKGSVGHYPALYVAFFSVRPVKSRFSCEHDFDSVLVYAVSGGQAKA